MPRSRAPHHRFLVVPMVVAGLGLAACGSGVKAVDGTAGPAGLTDPATTSGGPSDQDSQTSSSKNGCEAGGTDIPGTAGRADAGDLDGDGKDDQIWLDTQTLGVKTASGAVFETTFSREDAVPKAVANRLGDGTAIILLDTGFSAGLYAVVDCRIVTVLNVDGEQYSFDLGINGYGTGVGCPVSQNKLYLAGYNAKETTKKGYGTLSRTRIDLTGNGAEAANGTEAELGEYKTSSASWKIATGVSCGDAETASAPS